VELQFRLKKLIQERGVSISRVSKDTGIATQTIHNWLTGREPRGLKQVKCVADYFGVSIDNLCFGISADENVKIENYGDEINAGVFEVVLRRVKR
jgi:transcriptional regulator with XRE-family HTH domain